MAERRGAGACGFRRRDDLRLGHRAGRHDAAEAGVEGSAAGAAEAGGGGGVLGGRAHAVDGVDDLLAGGDDLRAHVAAADGDVA